MGVSEKQFAEVADAFDAEARQIMNLMQGEPKMIKTSVDWGKDGPTEQGCRQCGANMTDEQAGRYCPPCEAKHGHKSHRIPDPKENLK